MYLKKIKICNFRGFDETGIEIVFNKGINAIIGENNCGKSTVIDAIRIAFSVVSYSKDIYFKKSDFHIRDNGVSAEWAKFDVFLEDVPPYLIEIWDSESKTKTGGEFHVRFSSYIAPNGMSKVKFNSWGVGSEGNSVSNDTFEAIEVAFLGALRDSESEMKPSRNSKLAQLLKNIVPDEAERDDLVESLKSANQDILNKRQVVKARKVINENLSQIEQEILQQQIDIGLVEPKFDSVAGSLRAWVKPKWVLIANDSEQYKSAAVLMKTHKKSLFFSKIENGIYIETSILTSDIQLEDDLKTYIEKASDHTFELYQNGLGYNNLLFMSAVLGDMSIDKSGIYQNLLLIEEPEAHLHPQLQALVQSFLMDTGSNEKDMIQIIYTSHSPTLVSRAGIDNTNLIFESKHRKRVLNFSEVKLDDDDKAYLDKYLDITKSQMLFAKGILLVEGISEALLVPELAKLMDRSLDKYAVEVVNVDSVAFKPFVNLLSTVNADECFEKVAIITDDDRCANKKDLKTYISKEIDFEDFDPSILERLKNGEPSDRFKKIEKECKDTKVNMQGAYKTLEYALCCHDNNVKIISDVLKVEFPEVGKKLCKKIESLNTLDEKAACIWLFMRYRDKAKGSFAQRLSNVIKKQIKDIENNIEVDNKFIVPEYIKKAILTVTCE